MELIVSSIEKPTNISVCILDPIHLSFFFILEKLTFKVKCFLFQLVKLGSAPIKGDFKKVTSPDLC